MFRNLLVCSDGSPHSIKGAEAAGDLAKQLGATLTVLHVFQIPVMPAVAAGGLAMDPGLFAPLPAENQDAIVQATLSRLDALGIAYVDRREVAFSAPDTILRVAEEIKADLIVLGSRGAGAVERFLLGSTSDRVAHHAHCAVLIVK